MLSHHSVKNPTTSSCVLCCCYVEASAAATLVRYKLGKNLGGAIKGWQEEVRKPCSTST